MQTKPKQLIGVLVLSAVLILCFCMVALLVDRNMLASFDRAVIAFIQGMENPFLTVLMETFTTIGSIWATSIIVVCAAAFLYIKLRHRLELILLTEVVFGSILFNLLLKLLFQRERPTLHRIIQETGYSFPSGHSMSAFSLYAVLAFLVWKHVPGRLGRTLVIFASSCMILLIGISRIYLGVHYPSDVLGAYFASGFWFVLSVWFFQWYKEYQYEKKRKNSPPSHPSA